MAVLRALKPKSEADNPSSKVLRFGPDQPLMLEAGTVLAPFQIAYQTYGELNADKSNAVLVCHALTGDQHVANTNPVTGKPGWWEMLIGPGKVVDTNRYFVICSNVLGGCLGSTGPASTNPATGRPYALNLPVITIRDMVRAQAMLVDHLGIDQLFCVLGGSMGGMQVLEWAASHKERVFCALPIATGARHSSQNIAFHEVGRQAVMADPDWLVAIISSPASARRRGWRSRGWRRTSPISPRRRCSGSSVATFRTGSISPSASTRISRSRATCAIRA
jgi:homoserine O-acetyltransferase